ncbi:MAG: polysaccharide biosynthesis C-terminal domain-containing protein, partial [Oscillospiraceae bacterium]|nr:polysaccharide biosynthesis C-terminal domain-containing protein [Oscillospiraceae bacterium]
SFPLNSILHAGGKSSVILRILLFACCVKIPLSIWLCSIEKINIMGCIISQSVFYCIVFVL